MSSDGMFIFQPAKRQHAYLHIMQKTTESVYFFKYTCGVKVQLNICVAAFLLGVFKWVLWLSHLLLHLDISKDRGVRSSEPRLTVIFLFPVLSALLILWSGYKLLMRLRFFQCQTSAGNYEACESSVFKVVILNGFDQPNSKNVWFIDPAVSLYEMTNNIYLHWSYRVVEFDQTSEQAWDPSSEKKNIAS